MEKLYQQFKNEHPETVGEKDKHFDLSNYKDWLEKKHIELFTENKELIECLCELLNDLEDEVLSTSINSTLTRAKQLINKLTK